MPKLNNKIALVTGAADGIGAAIVAAFVDAGAHVYATDIDADGLRNKMAKYGDSVTSLRLDVCDETEWRRVIDEIDAAQGGLDILVNNAGGAGVGTIEDTDLDYYRQSIKLNLNSVFVGTQLALPLLKKMQGNIVNISSIHGLKAAPHAACYTAAKGGVTMLTKSVALHCAQQGYRVRCNSVHPGYIRTTQVEKWISEQPDPQALEAQLISMHPIGDLGEPADIANAVVFVASDDAKFMTGSEVVVDGGFSL